MPYPLRHILVKIHPLPHALLLASRSAGPGAAASAAVEKDSPVFFNLTDNNCSGEGLGGQGYGAFSPPLPFSFFSCCTTFTFFLLPVWHHSHSPAMCEERRGTGGIEGGVPLKRRGEPALRCVRAWPGTGRPLQSNSLDSWISTALPRCGWIVSRDNAHITPHGGIVAASSMQA